MAIINTLYNTNPYQDKIMGGVQGDPNPFGYQNQVNDFVIDNEDYQEIPGFNFKDAPTSLKSRLTNREFFNNPRTGFIDNTLMQRGNPGNTIFDKAKSGIGKGFDLGKAAFGGLASLVTGIPGIGALLGAMKETPQQKALRDFYEATTGLTSTGQIASGVMQGYNPVSGFGPQGLTSAIGKRISKIEKTLKNKRSKVLEQRLKELQALRQKEQQALERDRVDRARANNPGVYANLDKATGGKGYGDAGGFSTSRAGKEGAFGSFDGSRGRKDFSNGGLAGLL